MPFSESQLKEMWQSALAKAEADANLVFAESDTVKAVWQQNRLVELYSRMTFHINV